MAELIITRGDPWRVNVHDFEDKKLGKVVALWRVRYDHQCRLRQRRDHQRHRRVRRAIDPLPARAHGRSEAHNDRKFQPRLSGDRLEWAGSLSNWFPPNDIQRRGSDLSMTVPPWGRFNYE
jgi:hypothetical protein